MSQYWFLSFDIDNCPIVTEDVNNSKYWVRAIWVLSELSLHGSVNFKLSTNWKFIIIKLGL